MNYINQFIWSKNKQKLYIFYKYNGIGLIPCEIDFMYNKKHYSTIKVMGKIAMAKKMKWNHNKYTAEDWYDLLSGKFNKLNFVHMSNML